ncbi:hypothetical protein Osc7112_1389 [Oscillatoria nigro-viridis PCC 7112]|uniref:Uncharacterized protein n=1 Tax=Phormidium nigroviride PCC 7112 TaxID=179408 RepID=K9VF86_9CYAN|nr:hypothetical protein [Oscillatoria nigro-viridis]AFZ05920.1 hypothetical protein Osc7112_1389 [Oscillatoria nigro-viridis PCC 7112]
MSENSEIAVPITLTPEEQAVWDAKAKVRVLLNLWDLSGGKMKVKKGDLTKRIVRTNETSQRYVEVLGELQATGAIEYSLVNRVTLVELTAKGKEVLAQGLKSRDSLFEFDGSQIGTRLGNSLLKWIRHQDGAASVAVEKGKADAGAIASYEDFKSQALALFEKLDKGYNYMGLVPIWHLRRELGEQVSRENFKDLIMQMQADRLFYLQSGEARGATDEQKQDSISDDIRGLLFFASKPS